MCGGGSSAKQQLQLAQRWRISDGVGLEDAQRRWGGVTGPWVRGIGGGADGDGRRGSDGCLC